MDPRNIYKKTGKGDEEIRTRAFGLPSGLRRVLILVDGSSTVQEIVEKGTGLQDIPQFLGELEKQGYICPLEVYPTARIKEELIAAATRTLGNNAETVVRKIKEAPDTREGLEAAVAGCKKLVKLVIDEKKADDLAKECAEILGRCK